MFSNRGESSRHNNSILSLVTGRARGDLNTQRPTETLSTGGQGRII